LRLWGVKSFKHSPVYPCHGSIGWKEGCIDELLPFGRSLQSTDKLHALGHPVHSCVIEPTVSPIFDGDEMLDDGAIKLRVAIIGLGDCIARFGGMLEKIMQPFAACGDDGAELIPAAGGEIRCGDRDGLCHLRPGAILSPENGFDFAWICRPKRLAGHR